MMEKQIEKFQKNWEKNHAAFGQNFPAWELDFLYYIEANLSLEVAGKLMGHLRKWQEKHNLKDGFFIEPQMLHITLALPGRLGTHFQ